MGLGENIKSFVILVDDRLYIYESLINKEDENEYEKILKSIQNIKQRNIQKISTTNGTWFHYQI